VSLPVAVGETVCVPLVASVPLQLPLAVQLVAVGEDQVIVAVLPTAIEVADSVKVGVAGGASVTVKLTEVVVELPVAFVHASE
jgi:hypothetical protein